MLRRLSALALLLVGVSGCIVIPAHRHYGSPRGVVVVESPRGHGHGHGHGHVHRGHRDGPYRR